MTYLVFKEDNLKDLLYLKEIDLIILNNFIERFENPIQVLNLLKKFPKDTLLLIKIPNKDSLIAKLLLKIGLR